MTMQRRIAAVAVIATGLLSVGVSTASAHTGVLHATGQCQDDGTRLITYTGSTQGVPESQPGHQATLTVGNIQPSGAQVTPSSQTVVGNTTFTFTQIISGNAEAAQATGFLVWGDGATSNSSAMTAHVTFTTDCTPLVVVPEKPEPEVLVTHSEDKSCDAKLVTTTTITQTTDWILSEGHWVKASPVSVRTLTTRGTTAEECPVVGPPVVVTPPVVVVPPVVVPPVVVVTPVVVSPAEAVVNPLPVAAAAGAADTSGQLAAGGLAGIAAFLMLGAGTVLRRRRGEV